MFRFPQKPIISYLLDLQLNLVETGYLVVLLSVLVAELKVAHQRVEVLTVALMGGGVELKAESLVEVQIL